MTNEQLFELAKLRMQLDHEYRMACLHGEDVQPVELPESPFAWAKEDQPEPTNAEAFSPAWTEEHEQEVVAQYPEQEVEEDEPPFVPDITMTAEPETVNIMDMFKEAAQEYSEHKEKKRSNYPEVTEMGSRMHYYDDKIKHEYFYNANGESVLLESLVANDIKLYKGKKILSTIAVNRLNKWINENKYFAQGSAQLRMAVAEVERKAAEAIIAANAVEATEVEEEAQVEAPVAPVVDTRSRKQKAVDEWETIKHIAASGNIDNGNVTVELLMYAQKASQAESMYRLKLENPGQTDKWYSDHLFLDETFDEGDLRIALRMDEVRKQIKRIQPLAEFPDPYTEDWFDACYDLAVEWFGADDAAAELEARGYLYFDPNYDPEHIDYDALKALSEMVVTEVPVVPEETTEEAVVAFVEAANAIPELDDETQAMHEAFNEFYEAKPKNEFGLDARDAEEKQRTALRALKFGEGEITKAELTAAYLEDAAKYRAEAEAAEEEVIVEAIQPDVDDPMTPFEQARKSLQDKGAKFDAGNFIKELVAMGVEFSKQEAITHGTDMGLVAAQVGLNYMLHYKRS